MSNWDTIYQQFQQGGEAWATLSEGIDPRFIAFIQKTNFPLKHAFDIGCGTGKYLAYLQGQGFTVNGLDASPTAVKMTQQAVGSGANIMVGDMYDFTYPKNTYDLIVSISTIHHGRKSQV